MVVPVFITSCQVSEKWNSGPEIPQTMSTARAITNAPDVPVAFVALSENRSSIKPSPAFFFLPIGKPPFQYARVKRTFEFCELGGCGANLSAPGSLFCG